MRVNSLLTFLPSLCALENVSLSKISSVVALRYSVSHATSCQKSRSHPQQSCQSAPLGSGILPHHHPHEPSNAAKNIALSFLYVDSGPTCFVSSFPPVVGLEIGWGMKM